MNEKQMRVECAHGYGNAQGPRRTRGAVGAAHGATQGCESSLLSTLEPGEQIATVAGEEKSEGVNPEGPKEVVLDKGYHSNEVLTKLSEWEVRSYCSAPA